MLLRNGQHCMLEKYDEKKRLDYLWLFWLGLIEVGVGRIDRPWFGVAAKFTFIRIFNAIQYQILLG